MRRTHWATMASAFTGSLLILGLAACGDGTSPGTGTLLSISETSDIAEATADEVDQAVGSLTNEGAAFGVVAGQSAAGRSSAAAMAPGQGCATVDNTTDTDADGAPDNATWTFALPACSFTGFRGGTLEITGTIAVSDPTVNTADFNYATTLTDFQFKHISPNATRSFTATRNGTRTLTGDASEVSLTNNVTVVRSVPNRLDATVVHDLTLSFTAAAGQSLVMGEALPDGTFTKSGTLTWSRGQLSRAFTVSTVTPLVWDSSCTTDRKITSGEIHWTLPDGGYIKTVWTGCGIDPTRSFVRATAT
jgi:hypothetical protein